MQTLLEAPKMSKAFYAVLFDDSGKLAKVNGELMFFSDTGDITTVEPADVNFLTVLGQVDIAEVQAMWDRIAGGHAAICTHRQMLEVR